MNRAYVAAASLATVLAGCGSTRLSNELKPYMGKDIHELMARLGKPTGQQETTGDRVYVWSSDSDGVLAATPFAPSAGNSGGISYAGSPTPGGVIPVQFACTLEITVDAHNVIRHYEFEGSDAGCSRYRKILK
jgi:hypothetical protein